MSDNSDFGFAKFVPGFDFLQNLAKGASQGMTQMPGLSNWIAPTLNVDELDKRIAELKAVHFWLDQNGKALIATIQALEVQKMTLATLKGMNVRMTDMAEALKVKPQAAAEGGKDKGSAGTRPANGAPSGNGASAGSPVDPLQWWGSLTRQFQEIAANAMKDVAQQTGGEATASAVGDATKQAMKTAAGMTRAATDLARAATPASPRAPARKAAARKSAPRKKSTPSR
ncbi:PhaM family polyhydroxyalkanoate granule multifunctional regulatory protein [Ramlibacter sp.]|uniref:PhaM family polyhydroxyalkanoate granule multifunctional regulatory protein n=1 Tax=Ramlibacter sp. TaxID=1917967 RepID=UPI002602CDFC|nr:PhaM family polyhydroxyalkanoate granule multifunctional regulatory protein [Ramlibacter sp.]MDB5953924.1 hypothetical protein [Ramlibacter sp.]